MTLVEELQRLRNEAEMVPADDPRIELLADFFDTSGEAINEITRLTAENERLREALNALLLQALQSELNNPANEWGWDAIAAARAALEHSHD